MLGIVLGVAALGAFWLASGTVSANPGTNISLSPDSVSVNAGDSFDVDVMIDTDGLVRGVQFALDFDPSLLEVASVDEGPFLKDWAKSNSATTLVFPQAEIDNGAGHVSDMGIAAMGAVPGAPTGHGVVATYHLKAKAGAKGVSPLKLSDVVASDDQANTIQGTTSNNGQVGVGGADVQPLPKSTSGAGQAPSTTAAATTAAGKTPSAVITRSPSGGKSSSGSSNGLKIPWEFVGGMLGAVVVAGGVTLAVRKRRS